MRRLAAVASQRGDVLWYLDPKTALRPDPLVYGYVGKWSIRVSDWAGYIPKSGYPFLLEAELHPAPDGGTTLKGQVSPTFPAWVTGKARDELRTGLLRKVAGVIDATIDSPASAGSP